MESQHRCRGDVITAIRFTCSRIEKDSYDPQDYNDLAILLNRDLLPSIESDHAKFFDEVLTVVRMYLSPAKMYNFAAFNIHGMDLLPWKAILDQDIKNGDIGDIFIAIRNKCAWIMCRAAPLIWQNLISCNEEQMYVCGHHWSMLLEVLCELAIDPKHSGHADATRFLAEQSAHAMRSEYKVPLIHLLQAVYDHPDVAAYLPDETESWGMLEHLIDGGSLQGAEPHLVEVINCLFPHAKYPGDAMEMDGDHETL